jgi:uncharacterized protein
MDIPADRPIPEPENETDARTAAPLRIGLLADVHDHVRALRPAVASLAANSDVLIVLGDLVAPFVLRRIAEAYEGPVHVVFGNNDGDTSRLTATAAAFGHVRVHGELFHGTLGGRRIAAQHYPGIADLIDPGAADLVAYGHDHRAFAEQRRDAWYVNPGTLMGYDPTADAEVAASWAIYDGATHTVAFWRLEGGEAVPWEPGG